MHRANVTYEDSEELLNEYNHESSLMIVEKVRKKTKKTSKLWIVNSKVLKYITNQRDLFTKISLIDSVIYAANNRIMIAKEIRTIKVIVKNTKGKAIEISIYRVLYVP